MGQACLNSWGFGRSSVRAWGLTLLVLSLPALAMGQSLGEAARQERERREKLRREGPPARVVTDEDLKTTKGRLANEPNAAEAKAAPDDAGRRKEEARRAPAARRIDSSRTESEQKEAYWRARAGAARDRLRAAERRYMDLDRMIRFGQPEGHDENGRSYIYSQQRMKALADEAEAELATARKALEDLEAEARHAGALPGWLR
jgi:hypothetical protein